MKLLIHQPHHEATPQTMARLLAAYPESDLVLFPEGYLANEKARDKACCLARQYQTVIATSYRCQQDWPLVIASDGTICYQREKTPPADESPLIGPHAFKIGQLHIGYLLCMEILKGPRDFPVASYDFILHPIGVGMFSEAQLTQWLTAAKTVARQCQTYVIGCSHSDGSYKNCGISIPIAYCIDPQGNLVFLKKNDPTPVLLDYRSGKISLMKEGSPSQ